MLRTDIARTAKTRVAVLAIGTVLAVGSATAMHGTDAVTATTTTDLAGMMATVANESTNAIGSSDYYLKIDGIAGESRVKGHENEIQIESFSWGATNTSSETRRASGKVSFSDFSFAKMLDKASPLLFQAVASGKRLPKVTFYGVSTGERAGDYLTITLSDVLVSSYQNSGASGGAPSDSFSVNFAKITFDYKPQNADGSFGTAVHGGWDLKANKAV